jgi:molybdopterin-guanine dinucleotide biosynthesis protein
MRTIGIAGTAKNTGKTTTALEIIQQVRGAGLRHALTSIGYDGEDRDNITGLPKPRYYLPAGSFVATAERCLLASSAGYTIKVNTDVRTILGRIVVAEVKEPGMVIVAGPNRASGLKTILEIFSKLDVDLTIVDGAINRIVPLIQTDGLVLATGAAFDERIAQVARHAQAIYNIFTPGLSKNGTSAGQRISIRMKNGQLIKLETGSLLGEDTALHIFRLAGQPISDMTIPGACNPHWIERLFHQRASRMNGVRLVLGSPLKLVASGDPLVWSDLLDKGRQGNQCIEYLEKIPLLFMTVNPFYPRYLPELRAYAAATVDKYELLAAVQGAVKNIPVFNIKQPPTPNLLPLLGISV